jgi:chorismate-pyruvate lyase
MLKNIAIQSTLPSALLSITHPLDEFYARSGVALPPLEQIDGEEMPEPFKSLLVHQNDMTPTLENFHGRSVHLRVLGREHRGEDYFREVVLQLEGSEQPVEFGAIKIHLALFTPAARSQILKEQWPLGHILRDYAIPHASRPSGFLRVASDQLISRVLSLTGAHVIYGRRNTLFDEAERPLAEIVEILPPAKGRVGDEG